MLNIILYKLFFKLQNVKSIFDSGFSILLCKLKGVKITKCKFWGFALFIRHPGSKIHINEKCRFRSSANSNLIGIFRKCVISTHSSNAEIIIGSKSGFSGTSISAINSVIIGNNVLCGANTTITDFDWHNIDPNKRNIPINSGRPVFIDDNVFIGYGSIVLKGVTIGKNSIIGAGSVVINNIPENCIAAGNPCKVVKLITQ